jgi:two-component system response regulator DegU
MGKLAAMIPNQPPVNSAPLTVLVVDDHAPFRAVLKTLLAEAGAKIAECDNGAEALQRSDEFQPDWVLMDIEMPELDGLAATRALMSRRPQTRVVIVTQHDDPELRAEAARSGACAYVIKDDLAALTKLLGLQTGSSQGGPTANLAPPGP